MTTIYAIMSGNSAWCIVTGRQTDRDNHISATSVGLANVCSIDINHRGCILAPKRNRCALVEATMPYYRHKTVLALLQVPVHVPIGHPDYTTAVDLHTCTCGLRVYSDWSLHIHVCWHWMTSITRYTVYTASHTGTDRRQSMCSIVSYVYQWRYWGWHMQL